MARSDHFYFGGCLLNVVALEYLFPAVHAFHHFEVLVDLALLVGIPVSVFVFGVVIERILEDVVTFGVAEGRRRHSPDVGLVESQKFIHDY